MGIRPLGSSPSRGRGAGPKNHRPRSHMRFQAVSACAAALAVAVLAGCDGQIGNLPSGTAGSGSGTGNTTGSGSAGNGAAGTAGSGSSGAVGTAGDTGTAGAGGTAGPGGTPTQINLSGSPQYYRF